MVKELLLRGILLIPIAQNRKLLKNPNLASHYACMHHLGVIYGNASQSLPRQRNPINLELKAMVKLNCDISILRLSKFALQSLTGKLQGRITSQGDPCSHNREWVCRVQLFSVLVTFFHCFIIKIKLPA